MMPGDLKECRKNAARCAELAVAAHTPELRVIFLELSKNWEKLAIQLEDAFAKLAESEAIGSNVLESLDEAKRLSSFAHFEAVVRSIISKPAPPSAGPGT
jgi:hypothetical protein